MTFGRNAQATVISDKATKIKVLVPSTATTSAISVTTPGGVATTHGNFVVLTSLNGVVSLTTAGNSNCALLTTGAVDCWGYGNNGELGNGRFYSVVKGGSAFGTAVVGVGGSGTLSGVASLASTGGNSEASFCAVLTSGGVDCWGYGEDGELGDGTFYTSGHDGSDVPVTVLGVGGNGTLGDVTSLASDGSGFCALLGSGGVDCWGYGLTGELGDGTFYGSSTNNGSAVPVAVLGVGGSGTLSGAASLRSDTLVSSYFGAGYCAVLASGGVDCWGAGVFGELGDGTFYATYVGGDPANSGSAEPVAVVGIGGSGTLGGVTSLVSDADGHSYCALLASGGVDCWGYGEDGELGDGTFYTTGKYGSAVPVAVADVGGSGTLGGVASLASHDASSETETTFAMGGFCALADFWWVDCWGYGQDGELGDGVFYTSGHDGSAVPVAVADVGGSGTLGGVANLASDDFLGAGYCALLISGGVDCWGVGNIGQLGDGVFYSTGNDGSAVPVAVVGVEDMGSLTDVTNLAGDNVGFCAELSSGGVDCWGFGEDGELGDGVYYRTGNQGSAVPVEVVVEVGPSPH